MIYGALLPPQAHDLTGKRRASWTITQLHSSSRPGRLRWLAKCDCGREKVISASNWRMGNGTKTCHCQGKRQNYNQLPDGESSFNTLYYDYARRAERRGNNWDLSREQFKAITAQPCTYCGKSPSQVRNTTRVATGYVYSGVDRIDPQRGYSIDNVTACCGDCNRAKSDLTLEMWKDQIRRLAERLDSW